MLTRDGAVNKAKRNIIPINTGNGIEFRTSGGSGAKCNKPKSEQTGAFVSADDYRYASEVAFLDSLALDKQVFGSGGASFATFCDPDEEE